MKLKPAMKARIQLLVSVALFALQINASAGNFYTGLFNSPRGFGLSIDYTTKSDIRNSFTVYADIYKLTDGSTAYPGIKIVYLHYNRIGGISGTHATYDLFIAPGFSTGYALDKDKEYPGIVTAADLSFAMRMVPQKHFELEFGVLTEIGLISGVGKGGTQTGIYSNGLIQSLYPIIKIMYRF